MQFKRFSSNYEDFRVLRKYLRAGNLPRHNPRSWLGVIQSGVSLSPSRTSLFLVSSMPPTRNLPRSIMDTYKVQLHKRIGTTNSSQCTINRFTQISNALNLAFLLYPQIVEALATLSEHRVVRTHILIHIRSFCMAGQALRC